MTATLPSWTRPWRRPVERSRVRPCWPKMRRTRLAHGRQARRLALAAQKRGDPAVAVGGSGIDEASDGGQRLGVLGLAAGAAGLAPTRRAGVEPGPAHPGRARHRAHREPSLGGDSRCEASSLPPPSRAPRAGSRPPSPCGREGARARAPAPRGGAPRRRPPRARWTPPPWPLLRPSDGATGTEGPAPPRRARRRPRRSPPAPRPLHDAQLLVRRPASPAGAAGDHLDAARYVIGHEHVPKHRLEPPTVTPTCPAETGGSSYGDHHLPTHGRGKPNTVAARGNCIRDRCAQAASLTLTPTVSEGRAPPV